MRKLFITIVLICICNPSFACQWYDDLKSYEKFGIEIGFIGKLSKTGIEKDIHGKRISQWGKFEPVKMIRGQWSTSKKVLFSKKLDFPFLELNRLYVIHANNNGEYIVPCYWFGSLLSFSSIKDERFIRFAKYLSDPSPENYGYW